jgi:formyltetrahydrofolate synthetase
MKTHDVCVGPEHVAHITLVTSVNPTAAGKGKSELPSM